MKSFSHFCLLSTFLCMLFMPAVSAQEHMDEGMKAWMEYMKPGKMHEMLAKSVGEWKTEIKFWMMPGAEPQVSEGVSKNEMILDGRYMYSVNTGMMMGMPMEGINLVGYDNATNEFTGIWIDNMGTGTMVSKGKYDEEAQVINWTGSMVDPMTKAEMQFREISKIVDENTHTMEMYMTHEGQEFKSMEITFTRK